MREIVPRNGIREEDDVSIGAAARCWLDEGDACAAGNRVRDAAHESCGRDRNPRQ